MNNSENSNILLSVVLPSYNVSLKLDHCLRSLDALKEQIGQIEAIFVDDCSTDSTFNDLSKYAQSRSWVTVEKLPSNTGSPSAPRNRGMELAQGKFIFFLDPDDEILPTGVIAQLQVAHDEQADIVRSPLIRRDAAGDKTMNVIPGWTDLTTNEDKVKAMIRYHSTTVCGLYRLDFLRKYAISWPTDLRLAEDAVFLYSMLCHAKVAYSDLPDFIYHTVAQTGANASSTQQYEKRELYNHLTAWKRCTEILLKIDINYMEVRGQVALQTAFMHMIKFNKNGFSRDDFKELRQFMITHKEIIQSYSYGPRFKELCTVIFEGNFEKFLDCIKLRLLIAGYDLKFIEPVLPYLEQHFQVRFDRWQGHEKHNVSQSNALLQWADSVHCEWFLGNAVWYAKNKKPWQSLSVRLHRFELWRDYGFKADVSKIDRIIAIAPYIMEEMISKFSFPREKVVYIPNYVFTTKYEVGNFEEKIYNLAMIGSVPKHKGYHRALELLSKLRQVDRRYNLTVYGKLPHELPWVANNPEDQEYFAECNTYIEKHGLGSAIKSVGWADMHTELKDKGFVLSMSDSEGSHQAVADCFSAGDVALIWPWPGADSMYPSQYIFGSIDEMVDAVLKCQTLEYHKNWAEEGFEFVHNNYSVEKFIKRYTESLPIPTGVA